MTTDDLFLPGSWTIWEDAVRDSGAKSNVSSGNKVHYLSSDDLRGVLSMAEDGLREIDAEMNGQY